MFGPCLVRVWSVNFPCLVPCLVRSFRGDFSEIGPVFGPSLVRDWSVIGPCSVLGKVRICLLSFVLDAWPSLRPWLRLYARHWARNWPRPMAQNLPLPKAMGCTQAPGQGLASGLSQNPLSRLLAVSLGCGAWANPCVSAKALTTVFTKAWAQALATSTVAKALAKGFSMSLETPSDKANGCYVSVIGGFSM